MPGVSSVPAVTSKARGFPITFGFADVKLYAFTALFILLDVALPWAIHHWYGPSGGIALLPMHLFAFLAGLLFGWRAGLLVGMWTPAVSYLVSGMPGLPVLPQMTVEISTYGLAAGILRERLRLPVVWALIGAMAAGRLTALLALALVGLSHVGLEMNPWDVVWSAVRLGLPGIAIQLVLIPFVLILLEKSASGTTREVDKQHYE